jgi:hypothetical protein
MQQHPKVLQRLVDRAWQRRVARARSLAAPRTGAITLVQRFGGLVNLNVHFHLLIPDGVFTETDAGLMFTLLPAPTGRDLLAILDRVIRRVARRLAREQPDDAAADESPPELFAQIRLRLRPRGGHRPPRTACDPAH